MTKGVYIFVNGNVSEVSEDDFGKQIEEKRIKRLYTRFNIDESIRVRVYDTFSTELFDEYCSLDNIFIQQKGIDKDIRVERDILRKEDSLLVALIDNEDAGKSLEKYGREGDAVSEDDEPFKPRVSKAA